MNIKPVISVVMPVFNGETYLGEAIESVLIQTFTDFEFIIIDDGSTDNSAKILSSYSDKRIRIITNYNNRGCPNSLNLGLEASKGKYIARMDADDISLPQRFEKQVELLDRNNNVGLLGSSCYFIDESGHELGTSKVYNGKCSVHFMCHGSVLIRKSCLDKVGSYRAIIKYAEDCDLWLRLSEICDVANISEPLYRLRVHQQSLSSLNRKEQDLDASLAIEMAEERKRFGKDRLSTASPSEARAIRDQKLAISGLKLRKALSLNYSTWCEAAINLGDYKRAHNYAKSAINLYPLNFKTILMLAKTTFQYRFRKCE